MNIFSKDLKCVLIDWDGTLVDAEPMVHEAYVATFKELGDNRIWTPADTHARNGEDKTKIFSDKTLWGDRCEDACTYFYAHYNRLKIERPELLNVKESAFKLLDFIKTACPDVKIVILAAKTQELLSEEVFKKGFVSYVDAIVGHTKEGPNKPNVGVVDRSLKAVGLSVTDKAKQVMHIADNLEKDDKFAHEAGVISIIVNEKGKIKNLEQLRTILATVVSADKTQRRQSEQHQNM